MPTINSWNSNNPGVPININTTGTQNTLIGTSGNTGTISIGNTSSGAVTIDCGTAGITVGTTANAHSSTFGSTNTTSATTIQSGSGALNVTSTNGALTVNSGTGALGISTDASATTISIGTGAAVKSVTLGSTNTTSATTVQSGSGALNVTSTNGALTINSGTGALGISTDASATTVSIATGGAVKGVTLGSTNSTSATTVQSGSGALNITSTNGAITMNSGTGTVGIGTDATGATYNFATGAGAKVVTVGSTNGASSLALKYGTADFSLASATGNVMVALDTGEITKPLQPSFQAGSSANQSNVTGAGTAVTVVFGTEIFDRNGDFDGTSTFTAPVTGIYMLITESLLNNLTAAMTDGNVTITTSNRSYLTNQKNYGAIRSPSNQYSVVASVLADMDAADTATIVITIGGGAGNTAQIVGIPERTFYMGYLVA